VGSLGLVFGFCWGVLCLGFVWVLCILFVYLEALSAFFDIYIFTYQKKELYYKGVLGNVSTI
jgi:hypothetical protein